MKIEINEEGQQVLKEVFNSIILETSEGNKLAICMRDDTLEMCVVGSDEWYRADMATGKIAEL
jgi:hypothetical protein